MNEFFILILGKSLVPFIRDIYPDGHRFVQDSDPKHCSRFAREYYKVNGTNWWPTPPESPDLNPIELVWHEMEYLRRTTKPKTKKNLSMELRPSGTL